MLKKEAFFIIRIGFFKKFADEEISNVCGSKHYNIQMEYDMGGAKLSVHGVLNDEGTKLWMKGLYNVPHTCHFLEIT